MTFFKVSFIKLSIKTNRKFKTKQTCKEVSTTDPWNNTLGLNRVGSLICLYKWYLYIFFHLYFSLIFHLYIYFTYIYYFPIVNTTELPDLSIESPDREEYRGPTVNHKPAGALTPHCSRVNNNLKSIHLGGTSPLEISGIVRQYL